MGPPPNGYSAEDVAQHMDDDAVECAAARLVRLRELTSVHTRDALRLLLKEKGLSTHGLQDELVQRYAEYLYARERDLVDGLRVRQRCDRYRHEALAKQLRSL